MREYKTFQLASEVKAEEDGAVGHFTGRASVYGVVDSYGDVVMPGAFTQSLAENGGRIKVLAQHDARDVIGLAELADSDEALLVKDGRLVLDLEAGREAHIRLREGLLDGISIGYETREATFNKNGVRELRNIKLWEVSLVTFPANEFARVTGVKSLDDALAVLHRSFAEIKAGRVLSKENFAKLQSARDYLNQVISSQPNQEEEDEDGKAKAAADAAAAAAREAQEAKRAAEARDAAAVEELAQTIASFRAGFTESRP